MKRIKKKKTLRRSSLTSESEAETPNVSDSDIIFSLQIQYSYTVPEVAFLYLKLYQLAVRRCYQNVMKSILNRTQKRSRKGRVEAVSRKVEKALEKVEHDSKREREKKVCILATCFVKFAQDFVMVSRKNGFKEFKVTKSFRVEPTLREVNPIT